MKTRLIILLAYTVFLQFGITDSTCPRGGYRNEQFQFGPSCMYKCNCKNSSEQCEEVSGQCTSGCADRWMGPGCQYGDLAFSKPANQSSTGVPQMNSNPASVVDGNYTTCSNVTNGTMGIWWEVNLEKKYTITGLVITMHEIYYNQLFQVEVKNSSVNNGRYCVSDSGFTPTNREIQISCTEDIYGSVVRISSIGSMTWAILCDLRIFGGRNLAFLRNTTQSSTRYSTGDKTDGWPELGVDGGTNPNFTYGSCTHTNGSTDYSSPWWRVNLGHEFFINQIYIVNRLEAQDRLSGFQVKFWVNSTGKTVYTAPSRNPGLHVNVTDFSSQRGESVSIELSGGPSNTPRIINLCEVFVFGECPVNQCGWECEKSCYCKSAIVGSDKIEGICPDEDCLDNWTGTNSRCDYCLFDGQGKCPQRCNNCAVGSYCFPETATCLPLCDENHWGLNCSRSCGNCTSGDKCDPITGSCPGKCEVGWWDKKCSSRCSSCKTGTKCNKDSGECEICDDGKWGVKCDKTCGNCINRICNITVGVCVDGCTNGWWDGFCNQSCDYCETGTMCDQESGNCTQCPTGKWNRKCSQNCSYCARDTGCAIESGECKRCPNGRWGSKCSENCEYCAQDTECDINNGNCLQCEAGNWSLNCSLKCGQCFDDGVCDIKTARCIHGCLPSWQGDSCTIECLDGWYGRNCHFECGHCEVNTACDKGSGVCPGQCLGAFQPPYCKDRRDEEAIEKGVVIGVSIGAFLTLCLVTVVVVFLVNRKRRENILKSKMIEKSIQQSEDDRSVVYVNIGGSHNEKTTGNKAQEYAQIIHTNINTDVNRGRRQEDTNGAGTEDENNDMTQSSSSEKDGYYNGVGMNKTRIPLANLPDYIRRKAYDSNDLESEFEKLPKNPQFSMTIAQMPVNAKKNRYKGIYAYDTTRVELPPIADISGSDYINACFIRGFEKDRAYIASQGPTDAIVDDFWRMIWHCDVDKIVMLTELVEGGKIKTFLQMKCTQYWPLEGKCTYGLTEVEYLTEEVFADYTIRKFKIHQAGKKCKFVTKFHFTAWPDRGVPETPSSLVQFWSKVRNTEGKPDMPVLVHCSAGVGRTGTFIALDYLCEEGKQTGSVNVFACIYELRQQRVNMVQTKEQYVYLHEAVVEALMSTLACVPSVTFHEKYQNLLRPDRRTGKCLLQTEFEMLKEDESLRQRGNNLEDQEEEPEDEFTDATLSEIRKKNRYDEIVPASRYRPILLKYKASDNDYINAVILPSHKSKNAFLLTQTPLPNTVVDFLRLVLDNKVHTIVMFDNEIRTEERVGMYWPLTGNHASYGQVEVDVESTGHTDTHEYRLLNLTYLQTGEVLTVKQFICTFWNPRDSTPPICAKFFTFLEAIENWQKKNRPSPTVVHCLNGADRSGLYCVVSTILERLKIDSEVAISSVIRQMRIRRPQIVPNYEQFKFCHDVVAEFLSHSETYSNFKDIRLSRHI